MKEDPPASRRQPSTRAATTTTAPRSSTWATWGQSRTLRSPASCRPRSGAQPGRGSASRTSSRLPEQETSSTTATWLTKSGRSRRWIQTRRRTMTRSPPPNRTRRQMGRSRQMSPSTPSASRKRSGSLAPRRQGATSRGRAGGRGARCTPRRCGPCFGWWSTACSTCSARSSSPGTRCSSGAPCSGLWDTTTRTFGTRSYLIAAAASSLWSSSCACGFTA
mmetsp:Transcript_86615/g.269203  ORF Transcript_86615/g.269203 Transcript_86615/m.269203 type:complete len:220 (-) Transcript_86615:1096-1755(-)